MLYKIMLDTRIPSVNRTIEASSKEEAQKIAEVMQEDITNIFKQLSVYKLVYESPDNFIYKIGGIYLVRNYNVERPAVCTRSVCTSNYVYGQEFEHTFRLLKSGRTIKIKGKSPPRIGRMLCEDGKNGKESCTNCLARTLCYTSKADTTIIQNTAQKTLVGT